MTNNHSLLKKINFRVCHSGYQHPNSSKPKKVQNQLIWLDLFDEKVTIGTWQKIYSCEHISYILVTTCSILKGTSPIRTLKEQKTSSNGSGWFYGSTCNDIMEIWIPRKYTSLSWIADMKYLQVWVDWPWDLTVKRQKKIWRHVSKIMIWTEETGASSSTNTMPQIKFRVQLTNICPGTFGLRDIDATL